MIKPFRARGLSRVLRTLAAGSLLLGAATPSFGIIIGSYVVNPDKTVTYSYEVSNTDDLRSIFGWALEFSLAPDWNQFDSPLGDVAVPNADWIAQAPVSPGFFGQDFLSPAESGDVLPNSVLAGFSFTSTYLPGLVTYREFFVDSSASGQVIGPAVAPAASVPEAGGRSMEVVALLSLAAFGARLKTASHRNADA
jgi:hypothetical protein